MVTERGERRVCPESRRSTMRSSRQRTVRVSPLLMAAAATFISGCGGEWTPTPPPIDQATFESTVVSRVWTSRTGEAFQLGRDGVVQWQSGSSDGSLLGRSCARSPASGGNWRWSIESIPRAVLVLRVQPPDALESCSLTVSWFSDSGPLDWLNLSTTEGAQLRFFSAKP